MALLLGSAPTTWTQYTATISGEGPGLNQFRPGTAYVKPVVLTNRHGQNDNVVTWRDVEWTYAAIRASGTAFEPGN